MLDVVLVDDDDLYREVLSADLMERGFSVSCFAEGPSFLHAMGNGLEAKIGLLDWALPLMTGFDLMGALQERRIGLQVVFLTGYSLAEWELQALNHGAVDFVDKSRGTDVLAHRLRAILDGHRQMPAAAMPEVASLPADRQIQTGNITDRLAPLDGFPSFARVANLVATDGDPSAFLSNLTETFNLNQGHSAAL